MNNIETLARLFGNKKTLAEILEVDPAVVSRMAAPTTEPRGGGGRLPTQHNWRIREAMRDAIKGAPDDTAAAFVQEVEACLDPHVCPTCRRPLDEGIVL